MNRVINFYKRFGKSGRKALNMLKCEPVFKGVPVPFKQTPGRAQYYYAETLHLIPESILYQVRMPSKYADSTESTKYVDVVEAEILKYFDQKVSHNLFDPRSGMNLDLTIDQARQLTRAHASHFEKAESGELQKVLDAYNTSKATVDDLQDKLETLIDQILDHTKGHLKDTYKLYKAAKFAKTCSPLDFVPVVGKDSFTRMFDDVNNALEANSEDKEALAVYESLYHIAEAHESLTSAKLDMQDPDGYETYDQVSYDEAQREHESAQKVFRTFTRTVSEENCPFSEHLHTIHDEYLPAFKSNTQQYESSSAKREAIFGKLESSDAHDHTPDHFKEDLLAYLSGAIILKDHRHRYQAEQYDRYVALNKWIHLTDNMTLKEFSEMYARSLRTQVDISHNFLCPQIDANYDDYGKRTVNPISSTVFYFFFSAHRSRRRFAQVFLSAARFPNEKIRKAYLRFFANA
jgi:hypothetical protein